MGQDLESRVAELERWRESLHVAHDPQTGVVYLAKQNPSEVEQVHRLEPEQPERCIATSLN